jgi:hypothetical protein
MRMRRTQYLHMQHAWHGHVAGIFDLARYLARRIDGAHVLANEIPLLDFLCVEYARRQAAILYVARHFNGIENLLISGAAADIAAKARFDLLSIGKRIGPERGGRRQQHARDAIAALAGAGLLEGILQHAQFAGLGQPLDGLNGRPLRLGHRQQTRLHQHAIDEHRTGAAFAGAAAFLAAGEAEVVAQEVEQPLMRFGGARDFAAVDGRLKTDLSHRPLPVPVRECQVRRRHGARH